MTMQSACHGKTICGALRHARLKARIAGALAGLCAFSPHLQSADNAMPATNDYPTHARVEYVNECITRTGGHLSNLYQCSCAIDRIAQKLSYDDFVEASTFAKYVSLGGEGGAIFRDSPHAKQMTRLYRGIESEAFQVCGLQQ